MPISSKGIIPTKVLVLFALLVIFLILVPIIIFGAKKSDLVCSKLPTNSLCQVKTENPTSEKESSQSPFLYETPTYFESDEYQEKFTPEGTRQGRTNPNQPQ